MQKIKTLIIVVFVALSAACTPEYIEPVADLKSSIEEDKITLRDGEGPWADGKSPLFVINGEVYKRTAFAKMNPNDIASIRVYKGESAIKLYGEAANNGVVVITLKD